MAEATEQKGRTEIRSPIDGTVKNLRYNTIGGVVRPGEPIMEIVPERDRLVIEARLDPADRGYVRVGQAAVVKLSTYDFVRYGGLDGRVVRIAPDTDNSTTGRTFFRVVVETDRTWLGAEKGALPISPGMEATVDIKTGRRTVIDYLLRPILKLQSEAFRER
jgi:membrane fusion protein, adhesin transport system